MRGELELVPGNEADLNLLFARVERLSFLGFQSLVAVVFAMDLFDITLKRVVG